MPDHANVLPSGSAISDQKVRAVVDNLLRIAGAQDPTDPTQVANMLVRVMPDRAERDQLEDAGFPFALMPLSAEARAVGANSDLAEAIDAVKRALSGFIISGSDEAAPGSAG